MSSIQDYYRQRGYLVMASRDHCVSGPLERNDWNEDEMNNFRWSVICDSSPEELLEQNRFCGFDNAINPVFRFFYRVVALD
jgi:hypothetical protein